MQKVIVTPAEVEKIAKLANLPLSSQETAMFADQFSATVNVINQLNEVDTASVPATYQVTGLSNVTREDLVDTSRILSQEVALREAELTHDGFFVVSRVIDTDTTESVI